VAISGPDDPDLECSSSTTRTFYQVHKERAMRKYLLSACIVLAACGGNTTTAPTPLPPPQPAQLLGSWSGTLESGNYVPLAVFVTLNQTSTTVTGTWTAQTGTSGLAGNISGTVDASSFTGTITMSINQNAGCTGSFSGGATTSASTINWTSVGFTGNCNLVSGNPASPRFVLQRR
jgi:hypothetical protein